MTDQTFDDVDQTSVPLDELLDHLNKASDRLKELVTMVDAIHQGELIKHRATLARSIGAAIAAAMHHSNTGFDDMAIRLNVRRRVITEAMMRLLDGKAVKLETISDMFYACPGVDLHIGVVPIKQPEQPIVGTPPAAPVTTQSDAPEEYARNLDT